VLDHFFVESCSLPGRGALSRPGNASCKLNVWRNPRKGTRKDSAGDTATLASALCGLPTAAVSLRRACLFVSRLLSFTNVAPSAQQQPLPAPRALEVGEAWLTIEQSHGEGRRNSKFRVAESNLEVRTGGPPDVPAHEPTTRQCNDPTRLRWMIWPSARSTIHIPSASVESPVARAGQFNPALLGVLWAQHSGSLLASAGPVWRPTMPFVQWASSPEVGAFRQP